MHPSLIYQRLCAAKYIPTKMHFSTKIALEGYGYTHWIWCYFLSHLIILDAILHYYYTSLKNIGVN